MKSPKEIHAEEMQRIDKEINASKGNPYRDSKGRFSSGGSGGSGSSKSLTSKTSKKKKTGESKLTTKQKLKIREADTELDMLLIGESEVDETDIYEMYMDAGLSMEAAERRLTKRFTKKRKKQLLSDLESMGYSD